MFPPEVDCFAPMANPMDTDIRSFFSGTLVLALPQARTTYADRMLKPFLYLIVFFAALTAAQADPVRYLLQIDKSSVGFSYGFNGAKIKGTMPVDSADIQIDFDTLSNTKIQLVLNAHKARAGFIFATEAMRGKSILDATKHPQIHFVSTKVSRTPNGATMDGQITIRGVTKPIRLSAQFYRQTGSIPKDRSQLVILLTGAVSRESFGASGYQNMVGDRIGLRVIAAIQHAKQPKTTPKRR